MFIYIFTIDLFILNYSIISGAKDASIIGSIGIDSCYCPAGKYSTAAATCGDCAAGTYRDTLGATKASDCIPCPRG